MTQSGITPDQYLRNRQEHAIRVGKTLGPLKYRRSCPGSKGRPPKPVTIDGVRYPSMIAAQNAMGISDRRLRAIINTERT